MSLPFQPPIETMEARTSEKWPVAKAAAGFSYEPKWDGFRSVTWSSPEPRIDSRNQRPLLRYFPELRPAIEQLPPDTVVDGEIVVVVDDATSFDSIQLRLHPAESRIAMLSEQIPAQLVGFDLLATRGEDLRSRPFSERRERLEDLFADLATPWNLTPSTTDEAVATRWFDEFESAGCDGIIVKDRSLEYVGGKRAMIKIKHRRTVDCVVGGYREHKDGGMIGSLLLGLYDENGELGFIGHCSGFSDHDRTEIFHQFESLRSDESFAGDVRMPGGESRWSTGKDLSWTPVTPGVVVEVSYDQLEGNRFRHATRFHRWRPDKDAADCTTDQLSLPEGPSFTDVVG
jgi:ATP-dependent DNA ligase